MGQMVKFPAGGETAEGYLATPVGGSGPGLLVIQEWWGLVGHITEVADRFADEGYVALAPDLFHGTTTSEPDEARKLLMGLAMDRAARDMAGAAAYLSDRDDVTGGIGAVGFCMGGSLALWSATLSPDIVAAVGYYPAVPWERMSPDWGRWDGKAALIHCAEGDGGSGASGIQQAKEAIERAGGEVLLYDYPGTKHAFFNDRGHAYAPEAARQSWDRTLGFLGERLAA